jgi:hypothetical protein
MINEHDKAWCQAIEIDSMASQDPDIERFIITLTMHEGTQRWFQYLEQLREQDLIDLRNLINDWIGEKTNDK